MKFHRIYIELTNACGLHCSFCPPKVLENQSMDLIFFDSIVKQAKQFTNEIACHVVGDPLTLTNLSAYLDIIHAYKMKALVTTSGYFLKKHDFSTLFHPCVKQINISLNSFNKNDTAISFSQYISPILELCREKVKCKEEIFINLRMWNLDEDMSEESYNNSLFDVFLSEFGVSIDQEDLNPKIQKSIRLDYKVRLHFDNYFEWPSLKNKDYGHGTCQGLDSHIAILANGNVVPCCLDCDGVIELGNLHNTSLNDIVYGTRSQNIIQGFKQSVAVEELCQHCSYKERFNSL